MNNITAYYLIACGGRSLCLPAEDILYLASAEEVVQKQHLSCLRFSDHWYPVYSLNHLWIPNSGLQPDEGKVILLRQCHDLPSLALSCRSLVKLRTASQPCTLPPHMTRLSPVKGLIRQPHDWHLFATSLTLTHYFEKVLSYGSALSREDLYRQPAQHYVGMAG